MTEKVTRILIDQLVALCDEAKWLYSEKPDPAPDVNKRLVKIEELREKLLMVRRSTELE